MSEISVVARFNNCPSCGAEPKEPCVDHGGVDMVNIHTSRSDLAKNERIRRRRARARTKEKQYKWHVVAGIVASPALFEKGHCPELQGTIESKYFASSELAALNQFQCDLDRSFPDGVEIIDEPVATLITSE